MTTQEISENLNARHPGSILETKIEGVLDPYIKIAPTHWMEVASALRDAPEMDFDFLMCLSGVDWGKGILGVVYHLFSTTNRQKVTVRIDLPLAEATVASIASIWPSADWHEREVYDMFGITFSGHPDLRRILLPEDYPGHPLRKDFKVPEFYQGMKVPY